MTNRNFEDMDQLFREGLQPEQEPMTFQEEHWAKLNKRLDRHEKGKRGIFWISRLSGVAALILLFFVLWRLMPDNQLPTSQQAEVQQKDPITKEQQDPSIIGQADKEIASKTEPDSKVNLDKNKLIEKQPVHQLATTILAELETAHTDTLRVENLRVPKATTAPTVNSQENSPSQPKLEKSTYDKQFSAEEPLFAAIDEPINIPKPERPIRNMVLSVLAAPGYNGVNNLNNASWGNDFGLMVTVALAKNWSFSTGCMYAKKLYETGFSNYDPTRNIWDEYYPQSVNADCRVLDIPLNINYTFLHRNNRTMSIGSGISSYLMLSEEYRFTYAGNRNYYPQTYQLNNENQHWLGVLNLQANFDQRLNSRLSIGLQPYMKIPLKNIGFAGVKLQTLGMAVNLNYNFNL